MRFLTQIFFVLRRLFRRIRFCVKPASPRDVARIVNQLIQKTIMPKVSEIDETVNAISDTLDKVRVEFLSELEKLRNSDPDISPEGAAALTRLASIAAALDAIVPDAVPTPTPEPVAETVAE